MLEKVGITRTSWSSYENEISQPDIDGILNIADFSNISVEELLTTDIQKERGNNPLPKSAWAQKKTKQAVKLSNAAPLNFPSELEQFNHYGLKVHRFVSTGLKVQFSYSSITFQV